ncbi:MAG: YvcK family protein [Candidatus Riflebacteria bacterium]|nr:YvcK family protein [Candidatus Riflebacteria bacterium]
MTSARSTARPRKPARRSPRRAPAAPELPRIVCIGGGSGPSLLVKTLPECLERLVAVVTVTDSGSSTGIIRSNFGIAAPGDIRATLSVMGRLSGGDEILPRLMEYRFQPQEAGQLSNMAVGNLLLAAVCKLTGDFKTAIATLARILDVRGRVLPVSICNTDLAAELEDGTIVTGEVEVRRCGKPPIRRLFLTDGDACADAEVETAIRRADFVFIGPGNLYTSLLACLVFPGMAQALSECRGTRIFIANTTTAPGQTDGYSLADHLAAVLAYVPPGALDLVVLNNEQPSKARSARHAEHDVHFLPLTPDDLARIERLGVKTITAPLLEPEGEFRKLHKLDTMRHDPGKLRAVLRSAVGL